MLLFQRNKLNLQTAPPVINGTPTSNGINHSVLSSSDDADADDVSYYWYIVVVIVVVVVY